jgi:RNA polymerase sigma factor (sigma-70 family)
MYDRASDRELALRASGGDEGARVALVERAKLPLAGFFHGQGAADALVDDLVQDTLIQALDSLPSFGAPYHFVGWSRVIATRVWSRHVKKEARRRKHLQELWATEQQTRKQNGRDRADTVGSRLLEELARMPGNKRQLLYDRFIAELTLEELADKHGMTRSTVRREVEEAKSLLRRRIGETSEEALPCRVEGHRQSVRGKVTKP